MPVEFSKSQILDWVLFRSKFGCVLTFLAKLGVAIIHLFFFVFFNKFTLLLIFIIWSWFCLYIFIGRWATAHKMWDAKLCCSWGTYKLWYNFVSRPSRVWFWFPTVCFCTCKVINNKGYDGVKADLWSCGVILYVFMAGYLPFEESNLMALYKKVNNITELW